MSDAEIDDFFVIPTNSNCGAESLLEEIKLLLIEDRKEIENGADLSTVISIRVDNDLTLFRKSTSSLTNKQKRWFGDISKAASKYTGIIGRKIFNGIPKAMLASLPRLSILPDGCDAVRKELLNMGILLFYIRPPKGSKIDGATFLTENGNIAIAMSLRYDRLDYFWFTLLHELSHIILHMELMENGVISEEGDSSLIEAQANRLAKDSIINPASFRTLRSRHFPQIKYLFEDAKKHLVHPALIAGLVRNDMNNYSLFSDIISNASINREEMYE